MAGDTRLLGLQRRHAMINFSHVLSVDIRHFIPPNELRCLTGDAFIFFIETRVLLLFGRVSSDFYRAAAFHTLYLMLRDIFAISLVRFKFPLPHAVSPHGFCQLQRSSSRF